MGNRYKNPRSISSHEIKKLAKTKNLMEAISAIYERIQNRVWQDESGRKYKPAGLDWKKDTVLFLATGNNEHGCWYRYASLSIADAIDTPTGYLSSYLLNGFP